MLVLRRRKGQAIYIDDVTKVIFLGIRGNQIQIGIEAPSDIVVHREEVYERLELEKMGFGDGSIK